MAQKTAKYLLIIVLVVLTILVIIPPLHYGYIYPTAGDDTASHLRYFQDIEGQPSLYSGRYVIGKIMNALPFDINISFLWYHYFVLALTLWCVGLSVGLSINYTAGILASLGVVCINGLLELFHWGQIFDIVGIGVLLPIALLCLHNMNKGLWWKIGAILSLILFSFWHINGKYIFALLPLVFTYEVFLFIVRQRYAGLSRKMRNYRYLYYTASLSIILSILHIVDFAPSGDSGRLWMDGSILMILCVSGILGLWLNKKKNILISSAVIVFVMVLSIPNWMIWMQNNSAVKDVDKEAIAYLNGLNGDTYVASPQVAQDIYGLFVEKEFQEYLGADYLVMRTMPMTPRSDRDNYYYENWNREYIDKYIDLWGYKLLARFDEGETDNIFKKPITVDVYGK